MIWIIIGIISYVSVMVIDLLLLAIMKKVTKHNNKFDFTGFEVYAILPAFSVFLLCAILYETYSVNKNYRKEKRYMNQ